MWNSDQPLSCFGPRKKESHTSLPEGTISPGTVMRNFRFRALIGVGGFGEVYEAENVAISQTVAVKVYRVSDPNALEAFRRGANLLSQIRHPNVITVHDFFIHDEFAVSVMELLEPQSTLRNLVGEFGSLKGVQEFLTVFCPLLDALRYCHQTKFRDLEGNDAVGIHHGDIKPDNVFVVAGAPKLSDFMIPNLEEFIRTRQWREECFPHYDTRFYGTPMYMSPEQHRGNVTEQTDIYNIGVAGFELLTGFYPYESEDDFGRGRYLRPEYFNPYCPKWLSNVLVRCINHDLPERYKHVAEIQHDILSSWNVSDTFTSSVLGSTPPKLAAPDVREESTAVTHYDVGLSFAGEDRAKAKQLADILIREGVSVFYDEYEQATLWGKDLYQHLAGIYDDRCSYCVLFLSENYARKLWTRHELKQAQARAFRENREYILPLRIDDTAIPGIPGTIGYIDLRSVSVGDVAKLIVDKLSD